MKTTPLTFIFGWNVDRNYKTRKSKEKINLLYPIAFFTFVSILRHDKKKTITVILPRRLINYSTRGARALGVYAAARRTVDRIFLRKRTLRGKIAAVVKECVHEVNERY
jgi:hypothetical protein